MFKAATRFNICFRGGDGGERVLADTITAASMPAGLYLKFTSGALGREWRRAWGDWLEARKRQPIRTGLTPGCRRERLVHVHSCFLSSPNHSHAPTPCRFCPRTRRF